MGSSRMSAKECCNVPGNRWIGLIGQAKCQQAASSPSRLSVRPHFGEETVQYELAHFVAVKSGGERISDEVGPRSEQGNRVPGCSVMGQQAFLGRPAREDKLCKPLGFEMAATSEQSWLASMGQRQIHVVTAEQQVPADRGPRQIYSVSLGPFHADERQIGSPPSDITHQYQGMRLVSHQSSQRLEPESVQCVVECCLGFFQKAYPESSAVCRVKSKLACHGIEGRGHGEHDLLLLKWVLREHLIVGGANVCQQPGTRVNG